MYIPTAMPHKTHYNYVAILTETFTSTLVTGDWNISAGVKLVHCLQVHIFAKNV